MRIFDKLWQHKTMDEDDPRFLRVNFEGIACVLFKLIKSFRSEVNVNKSENFS